MTEPELIVVPDGGVTSMPKPRSFSVRRIIDAICQAERWSMDERGPIGNPMTVFAPRHIIKGWAREAGTTFPHHPHHVASILGIPLREHDKVMIAFEVKP